MKLDLVEDRDSISTVALHGSISGLDIAPPADPLRHLLGPACHERTVLLDLGNVSYLDSLGVSWLVTCNRRFRDGGGRLILHSLHPMVLNIIRMLKLDQLLTIAADSESANKVARQENA
jgi:anti-sigma B factor antagonist